MAQKPYFLRYQQEWLADNSRMKIAEKSRRIGWTYMQAYEDVRDAAKTKEDGGFDVWFSSADLSAAREYMLYVKQWAALLNIAAMDLGEIVLDREADVKALSTEFASGNRINALSSNPKGFRSKGGKVVLDEFGFHDQADELWKAAAPSITWGYPIRVFSSHNGKSSRFFRMTEDAKRPDSKWSLHKVTLEDAIADGLVGRIKGHPDDKATPEEIAEFIQETKEIAGDEETYQQEYMCNPLDDKTAYIPYSLIYANESDGVMPPLVVSGKEVNDIHIEDYEPVLPPWLALEGSRYFLGVDIGRKRDLTVLWLLEEVGDVYWTRLVWELHGLKFRHQFKHLACVLPHVARAAIDATGLGMQLAEEAKEEFGAYKVEEITFSGPVKEDLAVTLKRSFEDRALRLPPVESVRADINSIKKTVTVAGNIRFEGERTEAGHADRFWAISLARHAAGAKQIEPYESLLSEKRNAEGLGARR